MNNCITKKASKEAHVGTLEDRLAQYRDGLISYVELMRWVCEEAHVALSEEWEARKELLAEMETFMRKRSE